MVKFPSPPHPRSGLVHLGELGPAAACRKQIFFKQFPWIVSKRTDGSWCQDDNRQTTGARPSFVCTCYSPIRETDNVVATSRYMTGTGSRFPIGLESQYKIWTGVMLLSGRDRSLVTLVIWRSLLGMLNLISGNFDADAGIPG
jgi:hypothetical protein